MNKSWQIYAMYIWDVEVPWREMSGFRNTLAHNYLGDIDSETVLSVVKNHLPQLIESVQAMLTTDGSNLN